VYDLAIACTDARFGYPEVKIGFVAAIVSVFLYHTVGIRKSLELILTGKIINAEMALNLGLVHRIERKETLFTAAEELTKILKQNSPEAIKLSKQLVHGYIIDDLKKMLESACKFNADSRQNPDFKEGLLSFLEKRSPIWNK